MRYQIRLKRLSYAVSVALASLMSSHSVVAQESPAPAQQDAPQAQSTNVNVRNADADNKITTVTVVATRRSQQSAIERKKNAATAIDSIVAEDVGTLPDRNVGEALSRIAGISLDRGDFGEGVNVSVRGNGPELTRVELDGQAVQSAGGSDLNGGGDGRGTEFRQLSADLIKSVDVVKGSTADMTEGALGGGIRIETRNGLDFKAPFVSLRAAQTQNSLNKKWTPDLNLIASKKFMKDRLGVLLNASIQKLDNEGHQFQVSSNGNNGYTRAADFDNSPDKTFTYQPSTLDMTNPAVTTPWKSGAHTPLDLLTLSAAAKSKADCLNTFSDASERTTCLNQWNDYTPSLNRYFVKRQVDERKNLDLRFDFKVNDNLTVYTKGSYSRRSIDDIYQTYQVGNADITSVVSPMPAGYYALPYSSGMMANFNPATAVVDANHHVTQFTIDDAGVGIDESRGLTVTNAKYLQLGGKFRRGPLTADFMAGTASSDFSRGAVRGGFSYTYGPATAKLDPSGSWGYTYPTNPDFSNPINYVDPTPGTGGTPTLSSARTVKFDNPKAGETSERTAKLDVNYALPDSIPFFKRLKSGLNLRDTMSASWNPGGYTVTPAVGTEGQPGYVPAVTVPNAGVRDNLQGCQDTAGSLASGGTPCAYGWVPAASPSLGGTYIVPMQQYQDMLNAILTQPATPTRLFNGASGRPSTMLDNWRQVDLYKMVNMLNLPNFNYDCLKQCLGSDGKLYDQPVNKVRERSQALYLMADFGLDHIPFTEHPLPFGLEIEGNLGYRYVRTTVRGTGNATFVSITKAPDYTDTNPDTITSTITKPSTINAVNHVFLPSYNLATWVVPDKAVVRYSAAKTSSRPPVSRLTATGTCTFDQTNLNALGEPEDDMSCKTFGNPNLQGQSNFNQNLSLELYPNKDTMFSIAGFRQDGKVGGYQTVPVTGVPIFAGSNEVDPATGTPLANMLFDYTTYINGPVASRRGIEFSSKTAFTFLPWYLRYTGLDANATKQHSVVASAYLDPLSGEAMPPVGESKLSYNWALWYDDGKLQARVAVQMVGESFRCIAPCSSGSDLRKYPTLNSGGVSPPYNPGSPLWRDARTFVDGKISYRLSRYMDVFIEGRNLTNQPQTDYMTGAPYADGTPNLQNYAYAGRRITIGVNFRNQ